MRVYLINVGTNASDGFASPLFDDGRFEFVPILEGDRSLDALSGVVRYRDLRSHCEPGADLLRYVPLARHGQACHSDPEFATLTYGDNVGGGGRAANLRHAERGDALLFLVRLQRWRADGAGEPARTREFSFGRIGGLRVGEVYANVQAPPEGEGAARIGRNAHVVRAQSSGDWEKWGGFHVFAGDERSRRFERAVPVTRDLCDAVLRDKSGAPWEWPPHRTELSVIGSYTRTCRAVLDDAVPEEAERIARLRAWVADYAGERDAMVLDG